MVRAGSALSSLAGDLGIANSLSLFRLKAEWDQLFKGSISEHAMPVSLSDGRLLVVVDSPVWLQELSFMKGVMLRKLVGFGASEIRFKLGCVRKPGGGEHLPFKPLSERDRAFVDGLALSVNDPGLRESVRRAVVRFISSPNVAGVR